MCLATAERVKEITDRLYQWLVSCGALVSTTSVAASRARNLVRTPCHQPLKEMFRTKHGRAPRWTKSNTGLTGSDGGTTQLHEPVVGQRILLTA